MTLDQEKLQAVFARSFALLESLKDLDPDVALCVLGTTEQLLKVALVEEELAQEKSRQQSHESLLGMLGSLGQAAGSPHIIAMTAGAKAVLRPEKTNTQEQPSWMTDEVKKMLEDDADEGQPLSAGP